MQKLLLLLFLLLGVNLSAQLLVSPIEAMQEQYGANAVVTKKNILLPKSKYTAVQKSAKAKLDTKIYRIYTAKKGNTLLGYGILINRKVRSKNAVTLYFIRDAKLLGIEIIAFNEPIEYLPTKKWSEQFREIETDKLLQINRDIPSVSGATLSARSVTDGSRIAFALYNELLKEK